MLGVKIKGQFLSLVPGTSLSFDMAHPSGLFDGSIEDIPGGYSLPVELRLDPVNISLLGHVDRLDHAATLLKDEPCEVWVDGVPILYGTAHVKKSSPDTASLYIIFQEINTIKNVSLASLDLGGSRSIGADETARVNHAQDTVENPLDHDYIFAPLYNPKYRPLWDDGFPTAQQRHFQNFYSSDDDHFAEYPVTAVTPFIRLDYLLHQIFQSQGYTLDNQWQITDELKMILLYNNYNINTHSAPAVSSWDTHIDLINHVPYRNVIDLLKAVAGTFALALFYDSFDKKAELIPIKSLILAPIQEDWTDRAGALPVQDASPEHISRWRYDIDTNDDLSIRFGGVQFPAGSVSGEGLTPRIMYAANEFLIRYCISDNTYYNIIPIIGFNAGFVSQDMREVNKGGTLAEYISELIPMWNSLDIETDGDPETDQESQQIMLPHIQHTGYVKEWLDTRQTCTSFRIMIYRGFQPADVGITYDYPMASTTAYNILGERVGDYSLLWDREDGIYNQWWKLPYEMLRDMKTVQRDLRLTIRDILNFKWKYKYRIENQNYFITRMRFSVDGSGMSPVQATMVTTL